MSGSPRAASRSSYRRTAADWRRAESSMERPLDLLDQLTDVVQRKAWAKAEIAGNDLEWRWLYRRALTRETTSEGFIDDLAEGTARSPHFRPQLGCHVFVEGQRGSHALMLHVRHHDVNEMNRVIRAKLDFAATRADRLIPWVFARRAPADVARLRRCRRATFRERAPA